MAALVYCQLEYGSSIRSGRTSSEYDHIAVGLLTKAGCRLAESSLAADLDGDDCEYQCNLSGSINDSHRKVRRAPIERAYQLTRVRLAGLGCDPVSCLFDKHCCVGSPVTGSRTVQANPPLDYNQTPLNSRLWNLPMYPTREPHLG